MKMKRVLLLLLLVGCAIMSSAQNENKKESFSPATGIAHISDFDVVWEMGFTLANNILTSKDGTVSMLGGIGVAIAGYDANLSLDVNETSVVELALYPNPARELVRVKIDDTNTTTLQFYNTFGVNLRTLNVHDALTMQIDISDLPNGVYILCADDANGRVIARTKLVIQR